MGTPNKKITKKERSQIEVDMTDAHTDFEKKLNLHAIYKTHAPELSQDLVQTTFLKTILYLQRGGKIDTMRSFLNHVLRGLIIDEYRKEKVPSLDVLLDNGFEPSEEDFDKMINILDGQEIVELIKLLPPKYRKVMKMRYLQDLTLSEMSSVTGEKQNTMAVQAHRGLIMLKSLYHESHREKGSQSVVQK